VIFLSVGASGFVSVIDSVSLIVSRFLVVDYLIDVTFALFQDELWIGAIVGIYSSDLNLLKT